jgi:ribosomal protein S6
MKKNKEKEDLIEEEEGPEPRIYEVGYLMLPTISTDDILVKYGNIKDLIMSLGNEIVSDEAPKMVALAYTMVKTIENLNQKFDTAYFGWTKFSMTPEKVLELKKKLDLDPSILRFLIFKTIRENTVAANRLRVHRRSPTNSTAEDKKSTPINKEEIDKQIDAMVNGAVEPANVTKVEA